jgi:hypothetical protein
VWLWLGTTYRGGVRAKQDFAPALGEVAAQHGDIDPGRQAV